MSIIRFDLLHLSSKRNDFLFHGEWYIQKVGTSMGRDWASHYADIYVASTDYLDATVFKDSDNRYIIIN